MDSDVVLRTAVAVAILIVTATAVVSTLRIRAPWAPSVATARAAVQGAAPRSLHQKPRLPER